MGNRRRTWETGFPDIRGQGGAIQQRGHSAPPRFPGGVRREHKEHGPRIPHLALTTPQRGTLTLVSRRHWRRLECHPGSGYQGLSTPWAGCRNPSCALPAGKKRLALEPRLLRSPLHSVKPTLSPLTWCRMICRPAQPGCTNPLATASPQPCPARETSGGPPVDGLERPLTGKLCQRKPVRSTSRGAETRTPIPASPRHFHGPTSYSRHRPCSGGSTSPPPEPDPGPQRCHQCAQYQCTGGSCPALPRRPLVRTRSSGGAWWRQGEPPGTWRRQC